MSNIGLSFVIGGIVGSSFSSTMGNAMNSMTSLSDRIKGVAKTKLDIGQMMKLSLAGKAGSEEFLHLEKRLMKIGINTKNLGGEFDNLKSKLINLKHKELIQLNISSNVNKIQSEIMNARGLIAKGARVMGLIDAHGEVLRAQGEIASLGIDENGIAKITKTAKAFSTTFAGTTAPEFIRASYDIKSGISSLSDSGVAEFTKLAALTATATKATTADMTKLFAMGYGVYRDGFSSDEDFGNQFSNAISGAVQAFRTDGPDLIQGISSIGETAVGMGVSLEEQLAIIGTSKEAFNGASNAATGYSAFLKGVGNAQKELGLQFIDAEGMMLPMADILESIKEKYGESIGTVAVKDELNAAFGSDEAVKTISALIGETDSLRAAQANIKKEMVAGTKTDEMAKAMQRGKELQLLKQQFVSLAESVGSMLYPAFSIVTKIIGGLANGLRAIMDNCQPLGIAISGVAAIIMSLIIISKALIITKLMLKTVMLSINSVLNLFGVTLTKNSIKTAIFTIKTKLSKGALWLKNAALKAVSFTAAGVGKVFSFLGRVFSLTALKSYAVTGAIFIQNTAMKAAGLATKAFAGIQWLLNAAFLACPIVWIIGAVVALAAGAYLLIKNWDKVSAWFSGLWQEIKGIFSGGTGFISGLLEGALDLWLAPFKAVGSAINKVKSLIFGGDEGNKIGLDISGAAIKSTPLISNGSGGNLTSKYFGTDGLVTKANSNVNNGGNMTFSPQITIQGNANKEDVAAALDEGRFSFKKQMTAYNERNARLSYAGGD